VHIFDLWRFGILLHRTPALVIKALTYLQTHYNDFENMAPHNPDRQEARFLDMFQFMYRIPPTTVHENLAAMFKREEIYWEKLDEKVHVGIQMGYLDPTLKLNCKAFSSREGCIDKILKASMWKRRHNWLPFYSESYRWR
jgi:hypothetical protein